MFSFALFFSVAYINDFSLLACAGLAFAGQLVYSFIKGLTK